MGYTSLPLGITNTLTAKTTCSKKGAQNQRTKNTLDLSRQQKKQKHKREKEKQLLENRWIIEREKERERHLCFVFWTKTKIFAIHNKKEKRNNRHFYAESTRTHAHTFHAHIRRENVLYR